MSGSSVLEVRNVCPFASILRPFDKPLTKRAFGMIPKQAPVFSVQQSGQLVMGNDVLDTFLIGRSIVAKNFAKRRLKLLFDRCSKDVREGRVSVESVNRLSAFCLEIIPMIEDSKIVAPTATEINTLFDWYLEMQARSPQGPAVVLTTVCPDYPYDWIGTKAMFKSGVVGDGIGLIGDSIMKYAPHFLHILSKSLNISIAWIVGYAGFEGKPGNLESMNITAEEFRDRLEKSARALQQKLDVPVGILPDAVGVTMEQFIEIREGFTKKDFNIQRKGMDALSGAVDARDWASVYCLANRLNAIILDGASVYMGRKAYRKAGHILNSKNYTPSFFCVTDYMGFAS